MFVFHLFIYMKSIMRWSKLSFNQIRTPLNWKRHSVCPSSLITSNHFMTDQSDNWHMKTLTLHWTWITHESRWFMKDFRHEDRVVWHYSSNYDVSIWHIMANNLFQNNFPRLFLASKWVFIMGGFQSHPLIDVNSRGPLW